MNSDLMISYKVMKKIIIMAIIGFVLMQNPGIKKNVFKFIGKYIKDFEKIVGTEEDSKESN